MSLVVVACAIYANLSFAVTNKANYRYFPPFLPHHNGNVNQDLGDEATRIARSLRAGQGFSHPFVQTTGPTGWIPPIMPGLLAGLLWVCEDDRDAVMAVVIVLKALVLIVTGLLVLTLARQTLARLGVWVAAILFVLALLCNFKLCFQTTHDTWLVLLALDLLVVGFCWCRPYSHLGRAAGWGVFGGLSAQVNPIVGFAWGGLSLLAGVRQRAWAPLGLSVLLAGLTLVPWTVRNYFAFGRLVPVKSNLAYELYQSQCLQPGGLIRGRTFSHMPSNPSNPEGREFRQLGEIAYLDRKREQFWQAVWADPEDFLDRVAERFLGTTLWYVPFNPDSEPRNQPVAYWLSRFTFPLPFLAMLFLLFTAIWKPLHQVQWTVIGIYWLYLLPYIAASYYERYGMPLLGMKVLLVLWAVDRLLPGRSTPGKRAKVPPLRASLLVTQRD
jgi:hypothetical protein